MARIFLLRVGTELDFETVNLQVRELGFSSDAEKLYLGTTKGNIHIPTSEQTIELIEEQIQDANSAYDIWIEAGNEGTIDDFLASLEGGDGKSAYEVWLDLGNTGTEQDFIDSLGSGGGVSFSTIVATPSTPAALVSGDYYEVGSFDYVGESVINIDMTDFRFFDTPESGSVTDWDAPFKYSFMLYIQGGLTTPSESGDIVVNKHNVSRGVYAEGATEGFYHYYIDVDGKLKVYLDFLGTDPGSAKSIMNVYSPVSTDTGITGISNYYPST